MDVGRHKCWHLTIERRGKIKAALQCVIAKAKGFGLELSSYLCAVFIQLPTTKVADIASLLTQLWPLAPSMSSKAAQRRRRLLADGCFAQNGSPNITLVPSPFSRPRARCQRRWNNCAKGTITDGIAPSNNGPHNRHS